jgi:hypothetical protein
MRVLFGLDELDDLGEPVQICAKNGDRDCPVPIRAFTTCGLFQVIAQSHKLSINGRSGFCQLGLNVAS